MPKHAEFEATCKTLRTLLKGGSAIDPAHIEELTALTKKGFDGFIRKFP